VLVASATAIVAPTYGLLPDRIGLSVVFAAYGAGSIVGDLLATRRGRDAQGLGGRRGLLLASADWPTGVTLAVLLAIGLLSGVVATLSEAAAARRGPRLPPR